MGIFSSIFGGGTSSASEKSAQATQADNAARRAFIERSAEQARTDVTALFPAAQQVQAQGTQGALDVIGGGLAEQLFALTQGNQLARSRIAAGRGQFQNAILGLPTKQFSVGQFQQPDLSFLQGLQAPQVQTPALQSQLQPSSLQSADLSSLFTQIRNNRLFPGLT